MKKIGMLLAALLLVAGMSACGGGGGSGTENETGGDTSGGTASEEKGIIVFSTKTITNNEFQRIMVEAAQKTVEGSGYTFELILSGDELAVAKQVENIENAINKRVAGIIVAPMDGSAIIPALEKAQSEGIPVITADASIEAGHEDLYVTHVGSDNVAIGREAAEQMIEKIGEGKVLVVRGAAGAMGGELRAQGFSEGVAGSSVVIAGEQNGDWQNDVAMQVTENMLTANPDAKGIFLASDGMLSGVISACENKGIDPSSLAIISVDGEKLAAQQIEAGKCYGCVAQRPAIIGETSAQAMIDVLDGAVAPGDMDKYTDPGFFFMNPDTIEENNSIAF